MEAVKVNGILYVRDPGGTWKQIKGINCGGNSMQPLTFQGAASGVYDGSSPVTVMIPDGASGAATFYNKAVPLPIMRTDWRAGYEKVTMPDGSKRYVKYADTSKTGGYVVLEPGIEYIILSQNYYPWYFKSEPLLADLPADQKDALTYAGIDASVCKAFTEMPATLGRYSSGELCKYTPEERIYVICSNHERIDEPWPFTAYRASDVPELAAMAETDIYNQLNKEIKIYNQPFEYTRVASHQQIPAFFAGVTADPQTRRMLRRNQYFEDLKKSNFSIAFIGDSITSAASNAGLRRAFRKQVPYKLQVSTRDAATNGVCATNGFGFDWSTGSASGDKKGVDGLLSYQPWISAPDADTLSPLYPKIFVIALGTNDFGEDAPLGDVEFDDRSATFAGCYMKLVETIKQAYPKAQIVCSVPLNRKTAKEVNAVGATLLDYCRIIHEIVSITPDTWILDLSMHPLLQYDVYPSAYLDPVHINKFGHAVVANELFKLIANIIAVSGFDYFPCLDWENSEII